MYKKGGVWYTTQSINGKKKFFKLGNNKALAVRLEEQIRSRYQRAAAAGIDSGRFTVAWLLDYYFEKHCKVQQKKSTQETSGFAIMQIKKLLGDKDIHSLRKLDILEAIHQRRAGGMSETSLRREWCVLKHALNMAIDEWEVIPQMPVAKFKLPKAGPGRVRYLLPDEEPKLYESLTKDRFRWFLPVVNIARDCGYRRGNLSSLEISEVNMRQCQVQVRETKNGMPVMVPMTLVALDAFGELLKVRNLGSRRVIQKNGRPVSPQTLTRTFKKVVEDAGIEDFHFHDLRHDFGSRLVQAGVPIEVVQPLMGHLDIRSTQGYAHLAPRQKGEAIEKMEMATIGYKMATK